MSRDGRERRGERGKEKRRGKNEIETLREMGKKERKKERDGGRGRK